MFFSIFRCGGMVLLTFTIEKITFLSSAIVVRFKLICVKCKDTNFSRSVAMQMPIFLFCQKILSLWRKPMPRTIMKRLFFCFTLLLFLLVSCKKEEDFSIPIDGEGHVYGTLQIGSRTWMLGALNTTLYNDGSPILLDTGWNSADDMAVYCNYNNDPKNAEKYGRLYNWYAVNSGRLAPKGWHVATKDDWEDLARTFGGLFSVGIALKALTDWEFYSDSITATNESGLGLLPTGCRENYMDSVVHHGEFHDRGRVGFWWTSTPSIGSGGYVMSLSYNSDELFGRSAAPDLGAAVLCVKD